MPIEAFVMVPHDRAHRIERSHRAAQRFADDRVALHQVVLTNREARTFKKDAVGDRNLSDIVEKRATVQRLEFFSLETEILTEQRRVLREPFAMTFGVRIA